jgi:hypothetical protein
MLWGVRIIAYWEGKRGTTTCSIQKNSAIVISTLNLSNDNSAHPFWMNAIEGNRTAQMTVVRWMDTFSSQYLFDTRNASSAIRSRFAYLESLIDQSLESETEMRLHHSFTKLGVRGQNKWFINFSTYLPENNIHCSLSFRWRFHLFLMSFFFRP